MKKLLFKLGSWLIGKNNAYTYAAGYNDYIVLSTKPISKAQQNAILSAVKDEYKDIEVDDGMKVYFKPGLVDLATNSTKSFGIVKEGELIIKEDNNEDIKMTIKESKIANLFQKV
jgi:hypothetical protein